MHQVKLTLGDRDQGVLSLLLIAIENTEITGKTIEIEETETIMKSIEIEAEAEIGKETGINTEGQDHHETGEIKRSPRISQTRVGSRIWALT